MTPFYQGLVPVLSWWKLPTCKKVSNGQGMRHGARQSHNNSDIFCIPKVPMSKRHLTSELQCVDRTSKWQMHGATWCNLGSRKTHCNTRKLRENYIYIMCFRRMPTISSVSTADSGGAWIWDGLRSTSENQLFQKRTFSYLFGQLPEVFCWKPKVSTSMWQWHMLMVFHVSRSQRW